MDRDWARRCAVCRHQRRWKYNRMGYGRRDDPYPPPRAIPSWSYGGNPAAAAAGLGRVAAGLGSGADHGSRASFAPARVLYREYGGVFFAVLIRAVAL